MADVILQQFRFQTPQGRADCGNGVEDFRAFPVILDHPADSLDLAGDLVDAARQGLGLVEIALHLSIDKGYGYLVQTESAVVAVFSRHALDQIGMAVKIRRHVRSQRATVGIAAVVPAFFPALFAAGGRRVGNPPRQDPLGGRGEFRCGRRTGRHVFHPA